MNQDIDLQQLWSNVSTYLVSVDWLAIGMVGLLSVNVLFGLYFAWTVLSQPGFYSRYSLSPSQSLVQQAKQLEPVPPMDEIEVDTPAGSGTLPSRYANLSQSTLFAPVGMKGGMEENLLADTKPETEKKQLPSIEGYEIIGRIAGQGKNKASMLRRTSDGRTFVAREGEFLEDTDIKVRTVSDTVVLLKQPDHKTTSFHFRTDQIEQKIKNSIRLH